MILSHYQSICSKHKPTLIKNEDKLFLNAQFHEKISGKMIVDIIYNTHLSFKGKNLQKAEIPHSLHFGLRAKQIYRPCKISQ